MLSHNSHKDFELGSFMHELCDLFMRTIYLIEVAVLLLNTQSTSRSTPRSKVHLKETAIFKNE